MDNVIIVKPVKFDIQGSKLQYNVRNILRIYCTGTEVIS